MMVNDGGSPSGWISLGKPGNEKVQLFSFKGLCCFEWFHCLLKQVNDTSGDAVLEPGAPLLCLAYKHV